MPDGKDYKKATSIIAIDCEMVICEDEQSHLARLSVVNFNRHVLFDEIIKPALKVKNYLTSVTNLDSFKIHHARSLKDYEPQLKKLFSNRLVVGHTLDKDIEVLMKSGLDLKANKIRDIAIFPYFMKGKFKVALKELSEKFLQIKIQGACHSSVEDARAALELYKLYKKEIDIHIKDLCFRRNKKITKVKKIKSNQVNIIYNQEDSC